jgi:SAM-dependent methyltransferase
MPMPKTQFLKTQTTCLCGSARARAVLRADRYCTYGTNVEPFDYALLRCLACGLVRTDPPPAHDEHEAFDDPSFLEPYLARPELFESLLRPTVEDVCRLVPPGRLLDVGANIGTIVRLAGERGFDATGIELNKAAVSYANERGLDLRAVPLEDAGFHDGEFDVIVLSATAEHVPDLDAMFALCRRLLAPDGMLYVSNSPNYRSFGARFERELWYGIQPTGHVWQFTPATLRAVFERTGYRVVAARTYNLHRDFGRNRKERLRKQAFAAAERIGLGDALSMAGVKA